MSRALPHERTVSPLTGLIRQTTNDLSTGSRQLSTADFFSTSRRGKTGLLRPILRARLSGQRR